MNGRDATSWPTWGLAIGLSLGVHAVAFAAALSFDPDSRTKPGPTEINLVDLSFGFEINAMETVASLAPANEADRLPAVTSAKTVEPIPVAPAERAQPEFARPTDVSHQRLNKVAAQPVSRPVSTGETLKPVAAEPGRKPASEIARLQPAVGDRRQPTVTRRDRISPSRAETVKPVSTAKSAEPVKVVTLLRPNRATRLDKVQQNVTLSPASNITRVEAKSLSPAKRPQSLAPERIVQTQTPQKLLAAKPRVQKSLSPAAKALKPLAPKPVANGKATSLASVPATVSPGGPGANAKRLKAVPPASAVLPQASVVVSPVRTKPVVAPSPVPVKPAQPDTSIRIAALPPASPSQVPAGQASTGTGPGIVSLEALKTFDSGDCMLILPRTASPMRRSFAAFGVAVDGAERFQREMERRYAVDLSIHLNPLARAQCAATEFVRSLPSYPLFSMRIEIDRDVITSGETLTGNVQDALGWLSLIIVDDEGIARNVNRFLSVVDHDVLLSAPIHVRGKKARTAQVFLAIAAPQSLDTLADHKPRPAAELFKQLKEELSSKDVSIDVAVAAFRVECETC